MIDSERVRGVVVPLVTPITEDEKVDEDALLKLMNHVQEAGVHGIFVNSTTGEGIALENSERNRALDIVAKIRKKELLIFSGISDTSTRRTLQNLAQVEEKGADVAVLHPPFYYPANNQEELYRYYKTVAKSAQIPLMIYNIPSMTKSNVHIETVSRLMEIDNIIGIKDSSVDYLFLLKLVRLKEKRPDFKIFIGKSHFWTAGILSGADGALDGISNLIPGLCVKLYDTIQFGNPKEAFALQRKIDDIWEIYNCGSFLSGIKTALKYMGIGNGRVTEPIQEISDEEKKKIYTILIENGVITAH
ncbi:MAG: dihydrodipicolinate synthase family protein [Calditrichaeota bacterium]|nr:dihydrodipicolinate synthase family protein [Calditrichota bacterium]